MAGGFGTAEVSKNYPVPESSGIDAEDYHEGRESNLVPEEGSIVSSKIKQTL